MYVCTYVRMYVGVYVKLCVVCSLFQFEYVKLAFLGDVSQTWVRVSLTIDIVS